MIRNSIVVFKGQHIGKDTMTLFEVYKALLKSSYVVNTSINLNPAERSNKRSFSQQVVAFNNWMEMRLFKWFLRPLVWCYSSLVAWQHYSKTGISMYRYFSYCVAIKHTHASNCWHSKSLVLQFYVQADTSSPTSLSTLSVLLIPILGKYSLKPRRSLKSICDGADHDRVATGLLLSMSSCLHLPPSCSGDEQWKKTIFFQSLLLQALLEKYATVTRMFSVGAAGLKLMKQEVGGSCKCVIMRQRGQQCWHTDEIRTMRLKLALTDDKLYSYQTFIPSRKVSEETWWRTTKKQNTCAGSVAESTCQGDRDLTGQDSWRPLIQLMRLFTQHCWLDTN